MGHITRDEILMIHVDDRAKEYPLTDELEANLVKLLSALNALRDVYGKPMWVTSGYRPGVYNDKVGGAPHSLHKVCGACDFADPYGKLADWCVRNVDRLRTWGLQMENPAKTRGWLHLDIGTRPTTIFEP